MNNGIGNFERLAAAARRETAPAPDVAAAVMARVRREARGGASAPGFLMEDDGGLPLWSVAAALAVVGLTTAMLGYGMWSDWNGSVYACLPDFSSWRFL